MIFLTLECLIEGCVCVRGGGGGLENFPKRNEQGGGWVGKFLKI